MTEPAAAVQSGIVSNSFFPPSNLKLLTRKPLLPLDITVSESTTDVTAAKTTVSHSNSFLTHQTKEGHQSFPQQSVEQDNHPSDLHHYLLEDVAIIDMSPKQFSDHHVTNDYNATADLPNSEVTAESVFYIVMIFRINHRLTKKWKNLINFVKKLMFILQTMK